MHNEIASGIYSFQALLNREAGVCITMRASTSKQRLLTYLVCTTVSPLFVHSWHIATMSLHERLWSARNSTDSRLA